MFKKIARLLDHWISPPIKGEMYSGDALYFMVGKPTEQILHKMRTRNGDTLWDLDLGEDSYRLTIESVQPTYYVCRSQVLARKCTDPSWREWLGRGTPRRIKKDSFDDMVKQGILVRVPKGR